MRDLTMQEIEAVNGGVTKEQGAIAVLTLAVTATALRAPFAAGFALAVGAGLLYGAYFA